MRENARELVARAVEYSAAFLGRPAFIAILGALVALWVVWNSVARAARFDPYPFVFLILVLSIQASISAPLILFAQNRDTERSRVKAQEDRTQAIRTNDSVEYLAVELASTRIRLTEIETTLKQMRKLLAESRE